MRRNQGNGVGSIPAHAGDPGDVVPHQHRSRVYPRPRGGTSWALRRAKNCEGLSPPTRGNRQRQPRLQRPRGSIPAHAGEPPTRAQYGSWMEVYPRPRGGTEDDDALGVVSAGLSPPTRGNLEHRRGELEIDRSIPAHAGEPQPLRLWARPAKVYPRPRGGTASVIIHYYVKTGLSPPTRGNRLDGVLNLTQIGSIPAHAGEPLSARSLASPPTVYPRPRGGTRSGHSAGSGRKGLSPPTRGNRRRADRRERQVRSIPAHAGEPPAISAPKPKMGVYPRPRGGTSSPIGIVSAAMGLSPPTRGNHQSDRAD